MKTDSILPWIPVPQLSGIGNRTVERSCPSTYLSFLIIFFTSIKPQCTRLGGLVISPLPSLPIGSSDHAVTSVAEFSTTQVRRNQLFHPSLLVSTPLKEHCHCKITKCLQTDFPPLPISQISY